MNPETEYAFNMGISNAIAFMWGGHKVRRAGWTDKGTWIVLMPELDLPPFSDQTTNRKVNDRTAKHIGEDTPFHSNPYIAMWNARGEWQPGWVCSQEDLLATDWQVVV